MWRGPAHASPRRALHCASDCPQNHPARRGRTYNRRQFGLGTFSIPSRFIWTIAILSYALSIVPIRAAQTVSLCFENRDILPWRRVNAEGLKFALL